MLSLSQASWYETHNTGLGNFSLDASGSYNFGTFTEIQESPYILFSSSNSLITIHIPDGKLRDGLQSNHSYGGRKIIPDKKSGWNLFFTYQKRLGKLYIDSHGEFGEESWFDNMSPFTAGGIGIPKRFELWYFDENILCLDTTTNLWTEFDYPDGWNADFNYISLYHSDDSNSLIAVAKGGSLENSEAMWLNLISGRAKLIDAESGFFNSFLDIKCWKAILGYYLILKKGEIWTYNSITGEIEVLLQCFECFSQKIMQNNSGRNIYMIGEGNVLYIVDLIEKSFVTHLLSLRENDAITFSGNYHDSAFYDPESNRIITVISNSNSWAPRKLGIIDLDSYELYYIERLPERIGLELEFSESYNKLLAMGLPYIYLVDIRTGEVSTTISLVSQSLHWSAAYGDPSPAILPEFWSMYFKLLTPFGGKRLYNCGDGWRLNNALLFPDKNRVFMEIGFNSGEYAHREFDLDNNTFEDIDLPSETTWMDPDPENKQIITFKRYSDATVQFIKPHGKVRSWIPDNIENLTGVKRYFDVDNNNYLAIFINNDTDDWELYKLSTNDCKLVDSFVISGDVVHSFSQLNAESSGKYLYFIDSSAIFDVTKRFLVVFDLEKKEIIKRIVLQDNVGEVTMDKGPRVIPGIIPIPEHNKIFLWDHYGSWCINTNDWEVIYGDIVDNPDAQSHITNYVKGYWDEVRKVVVVIDNTYEGNYYDYEDVWRILEVDLETGNLIREINTPEDNIVQVFFPEDKTKIYMLSRDNPRYFIYNLAPAWENPAIVETFTNFLEYTPGDNCRLSIKIKNGEKTRWVKLFIWLCLPDGNYLFYDGNSFVPDITGIEGYIPSHLLELKVDLVNFTIPEIMPEGFYNLNAMFMNKHYEFGPMGTWNFLVSK